MKRNWIGAARIAVTLSIGLLVVKDDVYAFIFGRRV